VSDAANPAGGKPDPAVEEAAAPAPDFLPGKVVHQLPYTSPLVACRFDPSGKSVVTGSHDGQLQRWDLATGAKIDLVGHESWVRAIGFSPDGSQLFTGGYEGRLIWWAWEGNTAKIVRQVEAHDGWIRALSVSADGKQVATVGNDRLVKIWDAAAGTLLQTLTGHQAHIYSVLFPHLPGVLLTGDLLGVVHHWDLALGKSVRTLDAKELFSPNEGQGAQYGGVRSMSLRADGQQLACGGLHKATNPFGAVQEPLVLVFDWESGQKSRTLTAEGIPQGIIWRVVYHPSGILCAGSGGGSGGFLLCWREGTDTAFHKFQLPSTALDMDLHPASRQFATAHHDKHLRVTSVA
jgi:WD40 repeat protein